MPHCDRCGAQTQVTTMSYFNTETICLACDERERAHPTFEHAQAVEREAVRAGDHNFPGVGLPADLAVSNPDKGAAQ